MSQARSIAPKKSVISLEMELREKLGLAPPAPHESRILACSEYLAALPTVVPLLAPALDMVQLEFENAIFSNTLTPAHTENLTPNLETPAHLGRIPWFVLVSRLGDIRQVEVEQSQDVIADLQYKVKARERDISLLQKRIIALKQDFQEVTEEAKTVKERLMKQDLQLKAKDSEKEDLRHFFQTKVEEVYREKETLDMHLAQANSTIEKLSVFKATAEPPSADVMPSKLWISEKKTFVVPEPVQVTQIAIREAEVLMRQFFDITNNHLDDLEHSLMQLRKRKEILGSTADDDAKDIGAVTADYKPAMQQLLAEQAILTQHIDALRHALAHHQESRDFVEWKKYALETQRKYSVSLFYSTNGKEYLQYPHSYSCTKCAESVLMCPHQQQPTISHHLTLPILPETTHIQFRRPPLRIYVPPKTTLNDQASIPDDDVGDYVDKKINDGSVHFKVIWHFFFNKAHGKRPILPRVFTMDKLLLFISDFYDARWNYEQTSPNKVDPFMEFFLAFIKDRYLIKDIVLRVAFEILSSLEFYQDANTTIHLFVRLLSGYDVCVWKYLRLVRQLLQPLAPFDAVRYRTFVRLLYPARSDTLYEQLELEHFGAVSAPKLAADTLLEHTKTMVRRHIEPNLRAFAGLLAKYDVQRTGHLAEAQFLDCLMELLPQAPNELAEQQFRIAQHQGIGTHVAAGTTGTAGPGGVVATSRLAQIVAYLFAHLCTYARPGSESSSPHPVEPPRLKYLAEELEPYSTLEPLDELQTASAEKSTS